MTRSIAATMGGSSISQTGSILPQWRWSPERWKRALLKYFGPTQRHVQQALAVLNTAENSLSEHTVRGWLRCRFEPSTSNFILVVSIAPSTRAFIVDVLGADLPWVVELVQQAAMAPGIPLGLGQDLGSQRRGGLWLTAQQSTTAFWATDDGAVLPAEMGHYAYIAGLAGLNDKTDLLDQAFRHFGWVALEINATGDTIASFYPMRVSSAAAQAAEDWLIKNTFNRATVRARIVDTWREHRFGSGRLAAADIRDFRLVIDEGTISSRPAGGTATNRLQLDMGMSAGLTELRALWEESGGVLTPGVAAALEETSLSETVCGYSIDAGELVIQALGSSLPIFPGHDRRQLLGRRLYDQPAVSDYTHTIAHHLGEACQEGPTYYRIETAPFGVRTEYGRVAFPFRGSHGKGAPVVAIVTDTRIFREDLKQA